MEKGKAAANIPRKKGRDYQRPRKPHCCRQKHSIVLSKLRFILLEKHGNICELLRAITRNRMILEKSEFCRWTEHETSGIFLFFIQLACFGNKTWEISDLVRANIRILVFLCDIMRNQISFRANHETHCDLLENATSGELLEISCGICRKITLEF